MDESLIREQEAQLQKTGRYYKHICFMAVPVLCMACFLYGVRPLLLCGIAVLTGNLCDRLVSLLRRRVYQGGDFSNESFALVIALLMPVTVDIYVLIAAVLAGVLIGKEIFGGYGSYPFNPAAVGYVVAAVSWPEQVFRYPQPYTNIPLWDASMVPVSSAIEDTLRSGGMLNIGSLALGLGEYAAPMGTGAALVILACGLFLWTQKDAHMSASISFLVTCAVIAFFFPRQAGLADSAVLSNILPRLHFRIDFEKSERRKKRAQHTGTFSLRLRQQIGRPPETFGINLYDRHLIAVCNRMQYDTSCFFQHIWRKQAI